MNRMHVTLALPLCAMLAVAPAAVMAQGAMPAPVPRSDEGADGDVGEGFSLLEEGSKLILRGLIQEMQPHLDEMEEAMKGIEPALRELEPGLRAMLPMLRDLALMIDDLQNYDPPVKLPNGDILLRRRAPTETGPVPGQPVPGTPPSGTPGQIEL